MQWNAFNNIGESIQRTKQLLFPFKLGYWAKLTIVSVLSDFGGSGGGSSFNSSNTYSPKSPANESNVGAVLSKTAAIPLIGVFLAIGLVIGLLISYITSRFSFIYIDALKNKEYSISQGWRVFKPLGNSFFLFKIVFSLISIAIIALILSPFIIIVLQQGFVEYFNTRGLWGIFLDALPSAILLIIWIILVSIFMSFVVDFSLPYMYQKKVGIKKAIADTFAKIRLQKAESAVYIVAKILTGISTAIIGLIAFVICFVPTFIIGLILFFIFNLISLGLAIGVTVIFGTVAL